MKMQSVTPIRTQPVARTRRRLLALPLIVATGMALCSHPAGAQHGHLNAGAVGTEYLDKLLWVNGALFATNSGYVQNMAYATSGRFAGYYNSGPTLTALPATVENGGPAAFAAALSAVIQVQMTLLNAPEGGTFAYWGADSLTPVYNLGAGQTSSLWELSDTVAGAGAAGADPYGHIHGRRFTATVPGSYLVAFQLFDTSDLNPGATPFHSPSDFHYMEFVAVAVPEPGVLTLMSLGMGGVMLCWQSRRARQSRGMERL